MLAALEWLEMGDKRFVTYQAGRAAPLYVNGYPCPPQEDTYYDLVVIIPGRMMNECMSRVEVHFAVNSI